MSTKAQAFVTALVGVVGAAVAMFGYNLTAAQEASVVAGILVVATVAHALFAHSAAEITAKAATTAAATTAVVAAASAPTTPPTTAPKA